MPVIFRYNGVEFRLWSNDHDPAHIHVRPAQAKPDWEIIIYLGTEADGGVDDFGREFGDTQIVSGKVKTSTVNDLLEYLRPRCKEAWAKWEARIIARSDAHWDIIGAHYENGKLHIEFKDGTKGSILTSQFPALANATDADFEDLQVSPCGLILENANIEWDYAEAGLYELISS